jgi:hypothetical protein
MHMVPLHTGFRLCVAANQLLESVPARVSYLTHFEIDGYDIVVLGKHGCCVTTENYEETLTQ